MNGTKRGKKKSREIKFRIWDKINRMWLRRFNVNLFDIGDLPNVELMQYTGLKDKNGKEIYEGDVVKLVHFKDGRKKETGKVIFLHSQAGFGIIDRDGNEYPLFRNTAKQIEIIENIQENKR